MRLTTLARKLKQTPGQLITFLESQQIEITNGQHTKLDEASVNLVLKHFGVETTDIEPVEQSEEVDTDTNAAAIGSKEKEEIPEKEEPELSAPVDETPPPSEDTYVEEVPGQVGSKTGTIEDLEEDDDIELIKVKKVQLEGIKVVGKIDLPEKKEKDEKEGDDLENGSERDSMSDNQEAQKASTPKGRHERKGRKNQRRKGRQPLTYDEKLKEEERQKLKMRRRRENEARQRKIKYYENNIKPKLQQTVTKKRKKKEKTDGEKLREETVVHKNPLRRLWAWLNGKYDRY